MLHYNTLHYTKIHYMQYTTLHYTTQHYTTLHYTTLDQTRLDQKQTRLGSARLGQFEVKQSTFYKSAPLIIFLRKFHFGNEYIYCLNVVRFLHQSCCHNPCQAILPLRQDKLYSHFLHSTLYTLSLSLSLPSTLPISILLSCSPYPILV